MTALSLGARDAVRNLAARPVAPAAVEADNRPSMSDPKDRNPRSSPPPPSADENKRSGRAGVDDNARSGGEAGGNPYDNARNFGRKLQQPASAAPAQRKPMDLKRLEEWMQIKKRLEQQKKNEDDE
jgi:hypothetical protein